MAISLMASQIEDLTISDVENSITNDNFAKRVETNNIYTESNKIDNHCANFKNQVERISTVEYRQQSRTSQRLHGNLRNVNIKKYVMDRIVDANEATDHKLHREITSWTMMGDEMENQRRSTIQMNEILPELQLVFTLKPGMDRRRFNFQRCNEVAAVFSTTADSEIPEAFVELFHLRLLLLTVKGAKNYIDLKTVNGNVHQTFTATCLAQGLIEDDEEWKHTMDEATTWMMPRRLRRLFVRILIHCQPVHPKDLWEEFKDEMAEDYSRREESSRGRARAYAQISEMLNAEGWSLSDFPEMEQKIINLKSNNELLEESSTIGVRQYEKLNSEQKEIVDAVLDSINTAKYTGGACFYIDDPGSFTGISATLLQQGRTVDMTFGLRVPLYSDSTFA
ncbi:uncharacterized protein LOC125500693 [Athalia rosae]|uniref:uncharacterized protein LOC125500693 n=1 Tax=Athalia rosae TaxID=37344 RepID=UPI002034662A|nr:uncharacterized protein LOC125500693 [Athalia rosae]